MALTVIFALLGSMVLSLTLMPALASLMLPRRLPEHEPFILRWIKFIYVPTLKATMRHKTAVLAFAFVMLAFSFGMVAPNLGAEFIPRLSEGAIALGTVRLAGTSLEESVATNTMVEKVLLKAFPDEIRHVWSRAGTAEVATDPMGVELTDIFISLKPRNQWRKAPTQEALTVLIDRE
jgi:cobalt-zinc-cadmium resistance protein CzcA